MPYYYTLFREASLTGLPVVRPLFFADTTDMALRSEDDSFLLGDGLLIESQMVPDGSRVPARPKGLWREVESHASIDLPRMFVRGGVIVPTGPVMEYVDEKPLNPLTLVVCLDAAGVATGTLYEDAGDGFGYERGEYLESAYLAKRDGTKVTVEVARTEGSMKRAARGVEVHVVLDPAGVAGMLKGVDAAGFATASAKFNGEMKAKGLRLSGTHDRPVLVAVGLGVDGERVTIEIPEGYTP
jgi:alpha-glucosidase